MRIASTSVVQFVLRVDQLATGIEACSIEYRHNCPSNVQDWHDFCQCVSMHGQSCVNLIAVGSCQIELPNCEIILREDQGPSHIEHLFLGYLDKCPRKWHRIGTGLARIGMDWHGLERCS